MNFTIAEQIAYVEKCRKDMTDTYDQYTDAHLNQLLIQNALLKSLRNLEEMLLANPVIETKDETNG